MFVCCAQRFSPDVRLLLRAVAQHLVEDAEMLQYWEALGRAEFDEKERILRLPGDVNMLDLEKQASLYAREI